MKIARFVLDGKATYGVVEGDRINILGSNIFEHALYRGARPTLAEVELLPPVEPSKIVGVGLNYRGHAEEAGIPQPEEPILFLKPPSSLVGHGGTIRYPTSSRHVDYEGELAVVMGRVAVKVSPSEALDYVLGYTCANDVSARDLQPARSALTRGKAFDTFCPLGPVIATDLDPSNVEIRTRVNGVVKQKGSTSDMIFAVPELISFISHVTTLLPGDVILTGTPRGVGRIEVGDTVEVEIEGIGILSNTVGEEKELR